MNDKLKHKIIKYLNREYSDLVEFKRNKFSSTTYFIKDGTIMYDYTEPTNELCVNYYVIWKFLTDFFDLSNDNIVEIFKLWINTHKQYNVINVYPAYVNLYESVEDQYKLQQQYNS